MYALTRTCASLRTKMRAFFLMLKNHYLNQGEHVSGHSKHFNIFRAYAPARASCAYAARTEDKCFVFFCMDLNSGTFFSRFTNFQSFSTWYEFMRARLNKKLRARVNLEKGQKHTLFQTAIALQNARLPPFSFKYFDRVWVVDHIS